MSELSEATVANPVSPPRRWLLAGSVVLNLFLLAVIGGNEASFVPTTITSDKDPVTTANGAKFFTFPAVNGSKPSLEAAGDFAINFTANAAAQAFSAYLASPVTSSIRQFHCTDAIAAHVSP